MHLNGLRIRETLRQSLWFLPTMWVVAAAVLGYLAGELDSQTDAIPGGAHIFAGEIDGARAVLTTIVGAMVTVTAVVFSVTMLVLQTAGGQFTPRVLRTFLRDRTSQMAMGVFTGSFTYCLAALAVLEPSLDEGARSPTLTMLGAYAFVLLSVAMLVRFIDHTAQSIRVSHVIGSVAGETHRAIERLYPEAMGEPAEAQTAEPEIEPGTAVTTDGDGVVVAVDAERLMEAAQSLDSVVWVAPQVGEFVPLGAPLLVVAGAAEVSDEAIAGLRSAILQARERTMEQDAAFGFRQLIDIAVRALSPGVNDPSTAGQSLDQVHTLLRQLGGRQIPSAIREDGDGNLRLVLPRPGWDDYLRLSFEEVMIYGAGSPQTVRQLRRILADLRSTVPEARRSAIDEWVGHLEDSIEAPTRAVLD